MGWLILIVILWFLSTVFDTVDNASNKRIEQKKQDKPQAPLPSTQTGSEKRSSGVSSKDVTPLKHAESDNDKQPARSYEVDAPQAIAPPPTNPLRKKEPPVIKVSGEGSKRVYESALVSTLRSYGVDCLWHMTHVDNVLSITQKGLVSHERAVPIKRVDISDPDVQRLRGGMDPIFNRKIKAYSPTYIKIRNPMLYRLKDDSESLCLIEIALESLDYHDVVFTDGNAASRETKFYSNPNDLKNLPWDVLNSEYWSDFIDGKRKRCAEILVYPSIGARHITRIHCNSQNTLNSLYRMGVDKAVYSPRLFFG